MILSMCRSTVVASRRDSWLMKNARNEIVVIGGFPERLTGNIGQHDVTSSAVGTNYARCAQPPRNVVS